MDEDNSKDKVRRPRQSRSIKTKQSILKAAMELFSQKGYHKTNTKEIAALAGVSTGSFYSYYVDKRAVFLDALKLYHQEFNDRLIPSLGAMKLKEGNRVELISHFIDSLVDAHEVFTEFHAELEVMYHSDPEVKEFSDKQIQYSRELTASYMEEWKDELQVTDIKAASIIVFEVINRIVDVIVFESQDLDTAHLKKELVDMISHYLFEPKK
ncbi:TetR/AcrR family transcriptional regulator [Paenibacillus puldeungensis]|uniref:TetR/AcrR family transcriptional regulator n=1 Tax=Paenibacillus puldeungensis TaxID=696536 RepID=A0ABW3RWP1_9BACL